MKSRKIKQDCKVIILPQAIRIFLLFISGAACFTISQPLLRIPVLNYLQSDTAFILFYSMKPLMVGILIAFSAGIFEEGFRFIFKRSLFKTVKLGISEPIVFGLGHGLAEAAMVLLPYVAIVPLEELYLGILERFLAVIFHIGLTVIVWNGFQLNKKLKYLGIAILMHGLVNSLIPIFAANAHVIIIIENSLALVDILIIMYVVKSKKHYERKIMKKIERKISLTLCLFLCLGILSACAGSKLSDAFDEAEVKVAAEEVISWINNEDSEALLAKSTVAVKTALTEDVLEIIYEAIGEGGDFVEILDVSIGSQKDSASEEEFAVAVVKAKYENKNFIYTISFTKQMKMAGLYYK